jgi:hypothetical protein
MVSGSGQASPRASTIVTIAIVTTTVLAALLSTREPERLYAGLSALVSVAGDGEAAAALASFGALGLLMEPPASLERRLRSAGETPSLAGPGRETFARSLPELIDAALGLESLSIHACSASVETMALDPAAVAARLDGVKSTPRFLRDTAGARLIFV